MVAANAVPSMRRQCELLGVNRSSLYDYPPQRVAEITGLKSEDIVELAKACATTRPQAARRVGTR